MKPGSSPCRNGLSRCATHSRPGPIEGSRSTGCAAATGASNVAHTVTVAATPAVHVRSGRRSRMVSGCGVAVVAGRRAVDELVERLTAEHVDGTLAVVRASNERIGVERGAGRHEHDVAQARAGQG